MNYAPLFALTMTAILTASSASATIAYSIVDIGTFGGTESTADSINASGQATGIARVLGDGYYHAYISGGAGLTDIDTLGGYVSGGTAINNLGQIVGYSSTSDNAYHGFLYSGGVMSQLGTLGGGFTRPNSINSSGIIVGFSDTSGDLARHAFMSNGTSVTDLGTLGGNFSEATGINDSGQIVGSSNLVAGSTDMFAFVFSGSVMTNLGTLVGDDQSFATAINAGGVVTGYSAGATSTAFIWKSGTMKAIGSLGGAYTIATAINGKGAVVGYGDNGTEPQVAFVSSGNVTTDLNSLIDPLAGWLLTDATGINDAGQISGNGMIGGERHGFILTPLISSVPEPASWSMMIAGFCLAGAFMRRARSTTKFAAAR